MTTVLVPLDQGAQLLRAATLEVLTIARDLGEVTVLAFAEPSEELLADLGRYGVSRVLVTQLPEPATSSAVVGQAVASAAAQVSDAVVLLPSTFTSKEVAAHAAHHLEAGLLIDVGDLQLADGQLIGRKRVFGGTWETECAATTEVAVATVRPNSVVPTAATEPATPQVRPVATEAAGPAGLELLERHVVDHSGDVRPALAEAPIVVAGGRGTFGDFDAVAELADELGAAIGTTRDCVDEGWLGHDAQVGQTGTTIAPRVYIGAGISGAPHHVGGMSGAGTVIAVNIDDEAPLVQLADFAVIGDLSSVLADAAEALRSHRDDG